MQGLISKRGKESLKRRVADFSSSTVTPAVLKRAKDILNRYDLESVQIASAGAATFYQWVRQKRYILNIPTLSILYSYFQINFHISVLFTIA